MQLRTSLARLAVAVVAVAVVATLAGYLFATTSPRRAAAARVAGFVVDEPVVDAADAAAGDPAAPTSGTPSGRPVCGVSTRQLAVASQVASLAAGRVLVQYRPSDVGREGRDELRALAAERPDVLTLAPNPALAAPVVVTAWSRRMPLDRPDRDLVTTFVTAFARPGADAAPCRSLDRPTSLADAPSA